MSLGYGTNFGHFQKIKHCFGLRPFMESSILTVIFIFSFLVFELSFEFLVFELHKSVLQIILLISDNLMFLGSVDIGGYLIVACFER